MDAKRITIIGGGLAGLAAGVALQTTGAAVTLFEARKTLGGRAGSFEDSATGEILDNCQHVLLGCCTNLIDFYKRANAIDKIRFEKSIYFVDEAGKRYALSGLPPLPAPLHLAPAMAMFSLLTLAERHAVTMAMISILSLSHRDWPALEKMPFGHWLDAHHQPAGAVRKLYDPIVISGLNEETRKASAGYALKIFRDALLVNSTGYLLGLPTCPLSDLYANTGITDIRLGKRVGSLRFEGSRCIGVETSDGERIDADAVVLATNHHALSKWLDEARAATDPRFAHLDKLESVPILGAHLWFDRPVINDSHAAFVKGPLQWVFRKNADGSAVHGVISAARDWISVPKDQATMHFEKQIRQMLPMARDARLTRSFIVIEKRATFSPSPGADALRPAQSPGDHGIPGLYLAGDYTLTGWPATMEGAVRSGYLAAEAITREVLKKPHTFIAGDLPAQWPARWVHAIAKLGRR